MNFDVPQSKELWVSRRASSPPHPVTAGAAWVVVWLSPANFILTSAPLEIIPKLHSFCCGCPSVCSTTLNGFYRIALTVALSPYRDWHRKRNTTNSFYSYASSRAGQGRTGWTRYLCLVSGCEYTFMWD